ncbi:MAG: enoyl-CoA hydratase/isomerase family protein [Pseudobdellovibrionaceae bacterium]|nr:enoyl-CoA hydratase/isomerase family protein [Bdellovibrionales bacterium]USN48298.1 MAG: enoyl-CoA hydratase/isomerase family protein [Pseudobdellovibrionaceae bacterium]
MEFKTLLFERHENVGVLRVNRPEALNALNAEVIREIGECVEKIKADGSIRCFVVTGSGDKAFVAGADIKEMAEMTSEQALEMAERGQKVMELIEDCKIPSIAAVNGFALGGGLELALACDFIVASRKAKMGLPEVTLGLIPGYGGTQRLARSVGKGVARMMTLTGNMFSAEEASNWGLVARLTEPEDVLPTAMELAKTIASRGPVALGLAKRVINEGYDKVQFEALKLEAQLFADTFSTEDHNEGIQAFIEKRPPQFAGK